MVARKAWAKSAFVTCRRGGGTGAGGSPAEEAPWLPTVHGGCGVPEGNDAPEHNTPRGGVGQPGLTHFGKAWGGGRHPTQPTSAAGKGNVRRTLVPCPQIEGWPVLGESGWGRSILPHPPSPKNPKISVQPWAPPPQGRSMTLVVHRPRFFPPSPS